MKHTTTDHIMDDLAKFSNGTKKEETPVDDKFREVFMDSEYDKAGFVGKFVQ